MAFDAFISYARSADADKAPGIARGLRRLARPWYGKSVMRVFLDTGSLPAGPRLWEKLRRNLDDSTWLVLLASPDAAESGPVADELEHWLSSGPKPTKGSPNKLVPPIDRTLLALTKGDLVWDDDSGRFDEARSTALPQPFADAFESEPAWVDLRWLLDPAAPDSPVDKKRLKLDELQFRRNIADLAAEIRGTARDQLEGDERRQRRIFRVATSLVGLVIVALGVASGFLGWRAVQSERRVREQARQALSRQLAGQASDLIEHRTDVALLLGVAAYQIEPTIEARGSLLSGIQGSRHLGRYLVSHDELAAHTTAVRAIATHGELVATGDLDGRIVLWDAERGTPLGPALEGHGDIVRSIAFSPNGSVLASGSADHTVMLWDVDGHSMIGKVADDTGVAHRDTVAAVSFSPDGSLLVTGGFDGVIRIWDISAEHARLVDEQNHGRGAVWTVDIHDGAVVSGHVEGTAVHWQLNGSATTIVEGQGPENPITVVRFDPSGGLIAIGDARGSVLLLDPITFEDAAEPLHHEGGVRSAAFSEDGALLALGGRDGRSVMWAVERGSVAVSLPNRQAGDVWGVAFGPDAESLFSASRDGTVVEWLREPRPIATDAPIGDLFDVAQTPDGRGVVWAQRFGLCWQVMDEPRLRFYATGRTPRTLEFSPDGRTLAAGHRNGRISLWDYPLPDPDTDIQCDRKAAPTETYLANDDAALVRSLAFHPDGHLLASGHEDGAIVVWDLDTATPDHLATVAGESIWALAFGDDGTRAVLASGSSDGVVRLWDLETGEVVREFEAHAPQPVTSIVFHPTDGILASGGGDRTIVLWNVATGQQRGVPLTGHTLLVQDITFSSDGTVLASWSNDETVALWNVATQQRLGTAFDGPTHGDANRTGGVSLGPGGDMLAAAQGGGSHWDLRFEALRRLACAIGNRNLTELEWESFVGFTPYSAACPDLPVTGVRR